MKKFAAFAAALTLTLSLQGLGWGQTIEIEPELPQPVYGGTPLDYWGENLETPSFRPIPPIVAPEGTTNVALGRPVTSSAGTPSMGSLDMITNGIKDAGDEHVVEIEPGHQWVQIDLGEEMDIYAVVMWHFHSEERVYFDVAVHIGSDEDMAGEVHVVFNNDHDNSAGLGVGEDQEYIESYRGRIVRMEDGVQGRFVRLYSRGNTSDDANHYIEVEVYGRPATAK